MWRSHRQHSDEHVGILSALATVLADKSKAERLRTTTSVDEVLDLLAPGRGVIQMKGIAFLRPRRPPSVEGVRSRCAARVR